MNADKLIRDMVVKLSKDIYQDSLQPSAKTLGTELDQVVSALKIATLPFAVMGKSADYLLERYSNFLSESIRKVKNDLVNLLIKFRVFNKQTADDLLAKGLVSMDSGFFKPTSLGRKFLLTCTKPAA